MINSYNGFYIYTIDQHNAPFLPPPLAVIIFQNQYLNTTSLLEILCSERRLTSLAGFKIKTILVEIAPALLYNVIISLVDVKAFF